MAIGGLNITTIESGHLGADVFVEACASAGTAAHSTATVQFCKGGAEHAKSV